MPTAAKKVLIPSSLIKPIRAAWFDGFTFESTEWAVGIAKLAMNIGARSGRKGFSPETLKFHCRAAITKINVILEILCEYHFLVAKDNRQRFWVCADAFVLKEGEGAPVWTMERDWDTRSPANAPPSMLSARAAGWTVSPGGAILGDGEVGEKIPKAIEPEEKFRKKKDRAGGQYGEFAPKMEEAAGGKAVPEPVVKKEDVPAMSFLDDLLGQVEAPQVDPSGRPAPVDLSQTPTMSEAASGEDGEEEDEEEDEGEEGETSDRVIPDAGGKEFGVEEPRLRDNKKVSKGRIDKKTKETKEKEEKKKGQPTFFVVMDPLAPAAFSGETDKRSALDKLSDKFGDFASEPWKIINDAIKETNGNEHAAVKAIAGRIHSLSGELTRYIPPDKTAEWATYLESLQEKRCEGSGKKSDFQLANATIRFIMRFMARYKIPVAEIAMSLQEILVSRGERDAARTHAEIATLREEIDTLKRLLEKNS